VYTPEEIQLTQAFADQAALAMENARLFSDATRRQREAEEMAEVARTLTESLDPHSVAERIAEGVQRLLDVSSAGVFERLPHNSLRALAVSGVARELYPPDYLIPVGSGVAGQAVEKGEMVFSADVINDPGIVPMEVHERFAAGGSGAMMATPLRSKGKIIGALVVSDQVGRAFTHAEISLLRTLADQAALAMENARLYADAMRRQREAESLAEVGRLVSQSLDPQEVQQQIVESLRSLFHTQVADLFRIDPESGDLFILAKSGDHGSFDWSKPLPRGVGLPSLAVTERGPVTSPDILNDRRLPAPPETKANYQRFTFRSALCVPLIVKEQVVGVLGLGDRLGRVFTDEEMQLTQAFADQAALAIENARLFEETRQRAQEQSVLSAIATAVSQSLDVNELLESAADKLVQLTGRERAAIRLRDPITGELHLVAHRGIPEKYVEDIRSGKMPTGPTVLKAFETGQTIILSATEAVKGWNVTEAEKSNMQTVAAIPMKAGGAAVGVLTSSTNTSIPYTPRDVALLEAIGNVIAVGVEKVRLFEDSRRLVEELKAMTQELGLKNKELDTFVYTVSHDLKAPLVTLQGMAELLMDGYGQALDEQGQHFLNRLKANARQMEQLILDLLALSRIGREGRPAEAVPLHEVVDDVLVEWADRIRAKGIRVTCHELLTLWGLRTQIEQVMSNLVGNAVKYIGEPAEPVIEIGAKDAAGERGDAMVECYVRDNGIGIDPAYHEKVFEIFQRLKETEAEGTGVGLAIVKKIVEGAGGRVWVESAKGQGSTFRFTWPKAKTEMS
jgi:GAF domain-containing protein